MDCARFEEILVDIDRRGTRGAELRDLALAHAEMCGPCGLRMIESESLDFALKSLAANDSGRRAPVRVEAAVLQRFRREKGLAVRRRLQWQVAALAIAAAVLLALGVLLSRRDVSVPHQTPATNVAANRDVLARPSPVTTARGNSTKRFGTPSANASQVTPVAGEASGSEAAFVMLPGSDDPATLDGSAVVRVTLPRSALASFGLAMTSITSTENVSADLVVGEDGTPEAIRLVAQQD
ncbi:MAG: hypothetical protein ACRD4S_07960 [Candidatus Acidiferrales bacterium]